MLDAAGWTAEVVPARACLRPEHKVPFIKDGIRIWYVRASQVSLSHEYLYLLNAAMVTDGLEVPHFASAVVYHKLIKKIAS